MFFLLSNGNYEHIDRDASSEKVMKKLRKYEDKLEALLIESDTALRSDCYIVVLKDHIKKDFEPFKITYTLAFTAATDTPFESLIKRTLEIESLNDFYNAASLLYQMANFNASCFWFMNDNFMDINLIKCKFETKRGSFGWKEEDGSITDFLERQDMYLDAEKFLDASMCKRELVEEGFYQDVYDAESDMRTINYYISDRLFYLHLSMGRWGKSLRVQRLQDDRHDAYGFCIRNTGLLYLAPYEIASAWEHCQSCELTVNITRGYDDKKLWFDPDQTFDREYNVYSPDHMLALALYLPQLLDIRKYLFDEIPLRAYIQLLHNKRFVKEGEFVIEHTPADMGLRFDLFFLIDGVLMMPSRNISIDD